MKSIFFILLFSTLLAKPPSQNATLNAISPDNNNKKHGTLQNSLDNWLQNDWEPTQKKIEEKKSTPKKSQESNESFKLQTYVDRWEAYNKEKTKEPKKASHVEKLKTLPVIGK